MERTKLFSNRWVILMAISGMLSIRSNAQTQDLQQLILDIEKLTQLKGILADMRTGYQIYTQGYHTVSSLAKSNFNLHHLYLTGLLAISPAVRADGRITGIVSQQASLVSEYQHAYKSFRQSGSFSVPELRYMGDVYTRLITRSLDDLNELYTVLTAAKLRMSDAERLSVIDRIATASSDQLNFLRNFNQQGTILSLRRSKDAHDLKTLQKLYQIP